MAERNFARIDMLCAALTLERQESGKSILLLIFSSLSPSEVSLNRTYPLLVVFV